MKNIAAVTICAALIAPNAGAVEMYPEPPGRLYGPYRAAIQSVYDGDTVTAAVAVFPGMVAVRSIRVRGVDTPEIRGKCDAEKRAAIGARDFVRAVIADVDGVATLSNVTVGKYAGRVVADVRLGERGLASMLIAVGYGRPYDGGRRASWCDDD